VSVNKRSLRAVVACVLASLTLAGLSASTAFASSGPGPIIEKPRPIADSTDIYDF
jgi:hypothetical protein